MPKCTKCKKKFVSQYLLDKHLNREITCDQEIKCGTCGKIFKLKRDLERHMNRKTPCIKNYYNKNNSNVLLEIEKEKTKRELEKIKLQIELENKKQQTIQIKMDKSLEIEKVKTDRKEKTASVINNINTQNINIEAETYINNQFNASIVYTKSEDKNKALIDWYKKLENSKEIEFLCNDSKDLTDLVANIFKNNFNNDYSPKTRYFIYDKQSNKFLSVSKKSNKYEITEFSEISRILKNVADTSYDIIEPHIPDDNNIGSKLHGLKLYKNIYNTDKSLEVPAKIGLDPDNKKIKENKYGGAFSDSSDEDEYD
jgi:hypothetical protein